MNIYRINGLNDKTAVAPIRLAIRVCYKENNEHAYTMFRDVENLLGSIISIGKDCYIERIYLANNVGKEYKVLDNDELEAYDLEALPVYGAVINS